MREKEKTFHITVVDKTTEEVEHDSDARAVFTVYTDGETTTGSLLVGGDIEDFANVLLRAEQEIEKAYSRNPLVGAFVKEFKKQTQETEEDK